MLDGQTSDAFQINNVSAQGKAVSPILFSLYMDDLPKEIQKDDKKQELMFGNGFVGLQGLGEEPQHQMITRMIVYMAKWRLEGNVSKCAVRACSPSRGSGPMQWSWGSEVRPVKDSNKQLPALLHHNPWKLQVDERVKKCKRTLAMLGLLLGNKNLSKRVEHGLVMAVRVPTFEYAAEIRDPCNGQRNKLDQLMAKAGASAVGFHQGVASPAVLVELGLEEPGARIDQCKLEYYVVRCYGPAGP